MGLVLSGGGGKGAYQIGVFQALNELGLSQEIYALAGTSVGALNASLFLQEDQERIQNIWLNLSPETVLSLQPEVLINQLICSGVFKSLPPFALLWARRLAQQGLFSQEGLLDILQDQLDLSKVSEAAIPVFATCFDLQALGPEYFRLEGRSTHQITSILLASSAIPLLFGITEMKGRKYLDGGLGDNVPITPLYRLGCDLILVVYLERTPIIPRDFYPGCTILPIVPQSDPGGTLSGTLNFHASSAQERIRQGYEDARDLLLPYRHLAQAHQKEESLFQKLQRKKIPGNKKKWYENQQEKGDHLQASIQESTHQILDPNLPGDFYLDWERQKEGSRGFLPGFQIETLEKRVKEFLDRNQEDTDLLMAAALDAVSYLGPVQGRSKALKEQGIFQRFLYAITGKTLQISGANQKDLAQAQFAALTLLGELHRRGLMTLDFLAVLNNRVGQLFTALIQTRDELQDLSVAIYRSLAQLLVKIRGQIIREGEEDAQDLERALLDWVTHIQVQRYQGIPYSHLEEMEQVVCLVNDFFRITKGQWNVKELLSLQQAFVHLHLQERVMDGRKFFSCLMADSSLMERLKWGLTPAREDFMAGQMPGEEEGETLQSLYDLALELLYQMAWDGFQIQEEIEGVKEELLEDLHLIQELLVKYRLMGEPLAQVKEMLDSLHNFTLLVPLLGSGQSQKSLLLNEYLKTDSLSPNDSLQRSVATEIHLINRGFEKLEIFYQDGGVREYPLSLRERIPVENQQVAYQRLFLKRKGFHSHKEILLVDLPGLDSPLGIHQEAIFRYLEEGDFFILFLNPLDPLPSLMDYLEEGQDFSYALLWEDGEGAVDSIASLAPASFVGQVAPGDLLKLQELLEDLGSFWDTTLQRRFQPRISQLAKQLKQSLKALLSAGEMTQENIMEKRRALKRERRGLERLLAQEEEYLLEEMDQVIHRVMEEIQAVFQGQRDFLLEDLRAGRRIEERLEGLVRNTFHCQVQRETRRIFQESASRCSHFFAGTTAQLFGDEEELTFSLEAIRGPNERLYLLMTTAVGGLFGGPIGMVLGGLYGLFQSFQRQRQQGELLDELLEDLYRSIQEQGEQHLQSLGRQFLLLLKEKGERELKRMDRLLISMMEEMKRKRVYQREKRRQLQEDLQRLAQLIFKA